MAGFWKRVFSEDTPIPEMTKFEEPFVIKEKAEPVEGRMERKRTRVRAGFGRSVLGFLSGSALSESDWEDAEATLLQADLGVALTHKMLDELRKEMRTANDVERALRGVLLANLEVSAPRGLTLTGKPAVIMVVGVNGTGKTTTTGKLARLLGALDKRVVLAAADTFRAAAADQLQTWGDRNGALVVRGPENGDPASVAHDAVGRAIEEEGDVVVIDTAGRLHTKAGLMDELGKIKRVVEKRRPIEEVLLVLDATTGQNGLAQAKVFADAVQVTGVVLSKLDGTAKGGIVFAIQQELGVPVKFVGLGEGADDLAPFDPEVFVDALLG
jgi:fused signal recognition particle receptor